MSRVFLTASKDASIYELYPNQNAGYDEIIEVGKTELLGTYGAVRSLIQFDLNNLFGAPTNSIVFLNLKVANAEKLNRNEFIYLYAVSQSWNEGSGYFVQTPVVSSDGVTWRITTSGSYWAASGSDFNLTPVVSASLESITQNDLRVDVSTLIHPITTGSADNFGILLKFSDAAESDVQNFGNVKFFSKQTHTIHEPTLELVYASQIFSTGSLKPVPSLDIEVAPKNMKDSYELGEVSKIFFTIRDKYPPKTYTNTNRFDNKYYLPSSSMFSLEDVGANTVIVPFDAFSNVECTPSGSYVRLDTSNLYKERFYDLRLKFTVNEETFISNPFRFKIT